MYPKHISSYPMHVTPSNSNVAQKDLHFLHSTRSLIMDVDRSGQKSYHIDLTLNKQSRMHKMDSGEQLTFKHNL